MYLTTDYTDDHRSLKMKPGSYEWWYFDALDPDNGWKAVVIFYEGNPFSTRYIRALARGKPRAESFPAVSISIYRHDRPVYYSFTEFDEKQASLVSNAVHVKIGPHRLEGRRKGDALEYVLRLRETLPSGDALDAQFTFRGAMPHRNLFATDTVRPLQAGHRWSLIQPRATVTGQITIKSATEGRIETSFNALGYHDHNMGAEPMREEFYDWYWGRYHFKRATLVYYVMNRREEHQHRAWLIAPDGAKVIEHFCEIESGDFGFNFFGLKSARRLQLKGDRGSFITVQQENLLDSGPFYQRFHSRAFWENPDRGLHDRVGGISEYIRPDRIYDRKFWPLVHMRIRYAAKGPHWVQRSPRLYRWTW